MVALKVPPEELEVIQRLAKRYAKGNFSAWLRYAARRYRPNLGEVVEVSRAGSKTIVKKKR